MTEGSFHPESPLCAELPVNPQPPPAFDVTDGAKVLPIKAVKFFDSNFMTVERRLGPIMLWWGLLMEKGSGSQ